MAFAHHVDAQDSWPFGRSNGGKPVVMFNR
jgi:hypothetical protein